MEMTCAPSEDSGLPRRFGFLASHKAHSEDKTLNRLGGYLG